MPRSRKRKDGPVAVADTLETLKEEIPGLKAATELPRQLPPAEPELLPLPKAELAPPEREIVTSPEREPVRREAETAPHSNGDDLGIDQTEPGPHAAAVLAKRPVLAPPPRGYFNFLSDRQAGLRVSKSDDHKKAAIQFAETALPTRAEKDILERVGQPEDGQNFVYHPENRQWERKTPEGWTPGENSLDAVRVMQELAQARNEGRGR